MELVIVCLHDGSACVNVRVVDTCAGCKKDSKHVDLTIAAFEIFNPRSTGEMKVHMRRVEHKPAKWYKELWGPEDRGH